MYTLSKSFQTFCDDNKLYPFVNQSENNFVSTSKIISAFLLTVCSISSVNLSLRQLSIKSREIIC